jgi:hypothetical protein
MVLVYAVPGPASGGPEQRRGASMRGRATLWLVVLISLGAVASARATDEIQVYNAEIAAVASRGW